MPRQLLSISEIKELNKLLREVFSYITKTKENNPLGNKIKYPQLPSILTESLAIHLLKNKKILPNLSGYSFDFGGRKADILGKKGDAEIKIEVKATAKSAFQYFGEKDISADYIVWIHFSEFYMGLENSPIKIFIIKEPNTYFKNTIKITLSKLKKLLENRLVSFDLDIESL